MRRRVSQNVLLVLALAANFFWAACESVPLFAPSESTVTLSAPTRVLGLGGTTQLTAVVIEPAGTAVHDGTSVRFTTSLGRIDPVEVQTHGGTATTTFFAGDVSGVAEIRASSGSAGGGDDERNLIEISIGAAGANNISLRANPSSVGPSGGTVDLAATLLAENGRPISGVAVAFIASAGQLSATSAPTDGNGEARATLVTNVATTVRARAAGLESNELTIALRAAPAVTLTCQGAAGTAGATCSQLSGLPVTFTANRAAGTSAISSAVLDFGDGTTAALGSLSSTATVTHTYNDVRAYTATVRATDVNGESTSASVAVNVTSRPPISLNFTATAGTATAGTQTASRQQWTFDANATEGGAAATSVESYTWEFGDGTSATTSGDETSHIYSAPHSGPTTVTVTARTTDGRTATARRDIIVSYCTVGVATPGCVP